MRKRSGRPPRYAQVPNETIDDSLSLDLTALGLLTVFLRHQDGWDITMADVGRQYGYGEDAMANAMGMLQVGQYVVKVRVMGAGNQWRTEMAVFAPPATDIEVEDLLAAIRAEDPQVRRVEVIAPTGTALKRTAARRVKLASVQPRRCQVDGLPWGAQQCPPSPGIPRVGADLRECPDSDASSQVGPDSGVSREPEDPRVSKKTVTKNTRENNAVADAVGKSAGGNCASNAANEGATSQTGNVAADAAGGQVGEADGGCAASEPILPPQRTTSPRPVAIKTKPRQEATGFDLVRGAVPAVVARPGTRLYAGLHRAINDLLTGADGIPRRSPDQVIARMNRRWYGEKADMRSAPGYRGCDRCTDRGCTAPRRSLEVPDGCDRIKNRSSWLAAAILVQDCPDPGCEDGQIIGGPQCRACQMRAADRRSAAAACAETGARLAAQNQAVGAAQDATAQWVAAQDAEEQHIRQTLTQAGAWGPRLEFLVDRHMLGWRDLFPAPTGQAAGS